MKHNFLTALQVEAFKDGLRWKVISPLIYVTKRGWEIEVPVGFITDMASIPRVPLFWIIIGSPATGKYRSGAVIHDFLYETQPCSRRKADSVFLETMQVLKVAWLRRRAMWIAVRTVGWRGWNRHKKKLQNKPT